MATRKNPIAWSWLPSLDLALALELALPLAADPLALALADALRLALVVAATEDTRVLVELVTDVVTGTITP